MMCDFGGPTTSVALLNVLHELVRAFVLPPPSWRWMVPIAPVERGFVMRDMAPSAQPL